MKLNVFYWVKKVSRHSCLTLCALTIGAAGLIFLDGATNASFATHNVAVVPSTDCSACHLPASQADFIIANPTIVHRDYESMQTPTGALDCTKCHQTNGVLTPTNTIPEVIAAIAKGTGNPPLPVYCSDCHNFLPNVAGNHEFDPNGHENTFVDDPQTCSAVGCHVDNVYTGHVVNRGSFCFSCHDDALGDPENPLYRPEVVDAINRGSGDADTNPDFDPNGVNCSACHTTAGDHEAQHDMTRADSPDCLAAGCHYSDNVVTEHVVERGWGCQTCHDPSLAGTRPEIPAAILKGTGDPDATPPVPPEIVVCTECHIGGGDHVSVHDTLLPIVPGQDCTLCHVDNVVTEHQDRPQFTNPDGTFNCGTCHESSDPVVLAVIEAGRSVNNPNGDPTYCIACHAAQGEGHPAVTVAPWNECVRCHRSTSLIDPDTGLVNDDHAVHDTHNSEAESAGFDCTLCHVPAGQVPNCVLCHDNNTADPRLNIVGPGDEAHDFHTDPFPPGLNQDCTECHIDGVPGGDPIPAPYNVCSNCHNGVYLDPVTGLEVTDIAYGSPVHDTHIVEGLAVSGENCTFCHTATPQCTVCHDIAGPNRPDHDFHTVTPQQFDCMECHVNGIPGSDPLPEPYSECSKCHDGTTATDIAYGTLIHDDHILGLDLNGVPIDPNGIDCSYCHSPAPQCTTCHDIAGPNAPKHEFHTDPPQSYDCSECHVSNVPGGNPIPPPFNECSVCHNGEDGTTDIRFGAPGHDTHMNDPRAGGDCNVCHVPAGEVPNCTSCHAVEHHLTAQARAGDCANCHDDPRDPAMQAGGYLAKQLGCETCHVNIVPIDGSSSTLNIMAYDPIQPTGRPDGITKQPVSSHTFTVDAGASIMNYGACFNCHKTMSDGTPLPFHGHYAVDWQPDNFTDPFDDRPGISPRMNAPFESDLPFGANAQWAPGRGIFNVFEAARRWPNHFYNNNNSYPESSFNVSQGNQYKDFDGYFGAPAIEFSFAPINWMNDPSQQFWVPSFDVARGAVTPSDMVNITSVSHQTSYSKKNNSTSSILNVDGTCTPGANMTVVVYGGIPYPIGACSNSGTFAATIELPVEDGYTDSTVWRTYFEQSTVWVVTDNQGYDWHYSGTKSTWDGCWHDGYRWHADTLSYIYDPDTCFVDGGGGVGGGGGGGVGGGGGGGGSEPPEPPPEEEYVTITEAEYDDEENRLEVVAENGWRDNAELTVLYRGNSYPMSWDNSKKLWEASISSRRCSSTVEVVSSAGASDTSSVECESGGSWGD